MTLSDIINELQKFEEEYGEYKVSHIDNKNVCQKEDAIRILLNDGTHVLCIGLLNNN